MNLFWMECKKCLKSITCLLFIVVIVGFMVTQYFGGNKMIEPVPNQKDGYGMTFVEDPDIIMPAAVQRLYGEYLYNNYIAYPIGFYKNVALSEKEQKKIAAIISELSGISEEVIWEDYKKINKNPDVQKTDLNNELSISLNGKNNSNVTVDENGNYSIQVPDNTESAPPNENQEPDTENAPPDENQEPDYRIVSIISEISYEHFKELMDKVDDLIGGGSYYSDTYLYRFGQVPMTYEQALAEYKTFVEDDKVTGAYSRLFADYITMMLGILPVFLAVAFFLRDRRNGMEDLIYVRKISSKKVILTRFAAIITCIMVPVFLIMIGAQVITVRDYSNFSADQLAFFKMTILWAVPTMLITTAIGMFFTELTGTPIAVFIQGIWWFFDTAAGIRYIRGGYGSLLMPRHNEIGNREIYLENFNTLLCNRAVYTMLAILLVVLTIWIYDKKRGGTNYGITKIRKSRNRIFKA